MEQHTTDIAEWLGSNALIFLTVATLIALALVGALWLALVRYTAIAAERAVALWLRFAKWSGVRAPRRVIAGWARIAGFVSAYALIALTLALIATFLFVELADEIAPNEDMAVFDAAFTTSLSASITAETFALFAVVTRLGDPPFLTALAAAVTVILLWRRRWWLAGVWLTATAGTGLLTRGLKALFERTRPPHDASLLALDSWSFPSGHASGSLAVYTMLVYLLLRGRDLSWWHLPLLVAMTAVILMIGFSRAMLQVHYLSDVLGGYLVAASWVAACIAAAEMVRRANAAPGRRRYG